MFYTYVLRNPLTSYTYVGITDNLYRRLKEHSSGKSFSTKNHLPLKLLHVEIFTTRPEARMMEKYFKSGFGREIINEIAEVVELVRR